jgi:hypothetical protein
MWYAVEIIKRNSAGLGLLANNNFQDGPTGFPLFETNFEVVSKLKFLLHASCATLPLLHPNLSPCLKKNTIF